MFKPYTGLDYIKIDVANNFGNDKLNYEDRLKWFNDTIPEELHTWEPNKLKDFVYKELTGVEEPELVFAGLLAYSDFKNKKPSGYMVSQDSACSGMQLMSCLTADESGLAHTGLLGDNRTDLYSEVFVRFKQLYNKPCNKTRHTLKYTIMPFFYGSESIPVKEFGDNEEMLNCFYQACYDILPGGVELRNLLVTLWDKHNTYQSWVLPDNYHVKVPVWLDTPVNVTVHGKPIQYSVQKPGKKFKGISNAANVVHSVDAFVLREVLRRCSYDKERLSKVRELLLGGNPDMRHYLRHRFVPLETMLELYHKSNFLSVQILNSIVTPYDVTQLSSDTVDKLLNLLHDMYTYDPFPMVCIHDNFKCHPNNMNFIRYWYKEICADIVQSNLLQFLISQFKPTKITIMQSWKNELAERVRKSNYGLC